MSEFSKSPKSLYPVLRSYAAALVISIVVPLAGLLVYVLFAEVEADEAGRRMSHYHLRTEVLATEAQKHLTRLKRSIEGREGRSVAGVDRGRGENDAYELRAAVKEIVRIQQSFAMERYSAVVSRVERALALVEAEIARPGLRELNPNSVKSLSIALSQLDRLHGIESGADFSRIRHGGWPTFPKLALAVVVVVAVCGLLTWQILRLMKRMAHEIDEGTLLLRGSEERTRSILNAAADAIVTMDREGKILAINPAAERMFGYEEDRMIGESISFLTPSIPTGGAEDGIGRWLKSAAEENGGGKGELEGTRGDGLVFPIDFSIAPSSQLGFYTAILRDSTERRKHQDELQGLVAQLEGALGEVKMLKEQTEAENVYLRDEIRLAHLHEDVIGDSDALKSVLLQAERVAATGSTVLIQGETGTGKELVARAIHRMSPRSDRPLIIVNCAALPENLVESELFGREKGAYTGAETSQFGRFEAANGGTIFLDEVGELPEAIQIKLLRVLEESEFERLGSSKTIKVDVRLLAATNRNLEEAVREGTFREDLYYRLNVFPIDIPALRERVEDIPVIARHFVEEIGESMGKKFETISRKTLDDLENYSWPGNVRELRNVIERAVIVSRGKTLRVDVPGEAEHRNPFSRRTLAEVEKEHIVAMLKRAGWKIRGQGGAAEFLGLPPSTLESRMKKLGIMRPTTPDPSLPKRR